MPLTFPCPNPACTQVFLPQDVRGVATLTCPKCGLVFQFAAGATPAPPPPPRVAPPAPKPTPVTAKAPPAIPLAQPVSAEPPSELIVPPPEPRVPQRSARTVPTPGRVKRSRKRWLIPAVLGVLFVALGGAGWFLRDSWETAPAETDMADVKSPAMNYRFRYPRGPWERDPAVEREVGASFAMRRHDPNSWFAVVVRDFKDRMPRDDEMVREAIARLQKLFKKGVEWEQRDESTFADLPAQRLVFTAENKSNVPVSGECLMTASSGIGYWFFGWTPSATDESVLAAVQQEWGTVREGFGLLKEREGWTGKTPEIVAAEGKKAAYRLNYTRGLWEKDNSEDADLVLLGRDPDAPQDGRKWAWVRVFKLPAAADPETALKEARTFVEQREKKLYPEVKMEAVPQAARGGLADGAVELGQSPGRVARLRVQKGEDYDFFFAVAAVPRPGYTLVLVGECAWPQREAWESRFGPVLHSLHFDAK
jgi:hypothetical protein